MRLGRRPSWTSSEESLVRLGENWPGEFHVGHGMDFAVLEGAGIESADAVSSPDDGDNTNIVVSQVAKERYEHRIGGRALLDPARAEFSRPGLHVVSPTATAINGLASRALSAGAD